MFVITFIFSSCEKNDLDSIDKAVLQIAEDGTVVDGRFFFSSKGSLKEQIQSLEKEEVSFVENKFEKLYNKGFRSHKPIINPNNERLLHKFSSEKKQGYALKIKNKLLEDVAEEEAFIADPFFAGVINQDNEIIVGDTLYKYTKESGLYFVHIKDSTKLFDFFKNESQNKAYFKAPVKNTCEDRRRVGGITSVDDKILRYVAPIEENCNKEYPDRSIVTFKPSSVANEPSIQEVINKLPECNEKDSRFQNLFGDNYYCYDYWTDTRRVKTEFWSQKWLVYESVGIQVKSQRRYLGVWIRDKTDELYLGINKVYLKYSFKMPEIKFDPYSTYGFNSSKTPLFMYNETFNMKMSHLGNFTEVSLNVVKNSIPFFEFENEDLLNIYIPNLPIINDYNINLRTEDIFSQSNIKQLYKMGFDFLRSKIGKKKEFVVTYQKDPNHIEVLYFGEQRHKNNARLIKKYFYRDLGFQVKTVVGINPNAGTNINKEGPYAVSLYDSNFSAEPLDDFFRSYVDYKVDFYGMGRRGNVWRGSRMAKEKK